MAEFKAGDKIKAIHLNMEETVRANCGHTIVVEMEMGWHCDMPWFAVYDPDGNLSTKWNAAMVAGVTFYISEENG